MRTGKDILKIKDYYEMCPIQKMIVETKIIAIATIQFNENHSLPVSIRRTYLNAKKYSVPLVDAIIRSSHLMKEYEQKHKLKREVKKFDMNRCYEKIGLEKII